MPFLKLVHDYWAANMWAIYLFASKVASFLLRKAPIPSKLRRTIEFFAIIPFPEPPPSAVALCLLVGLIPCMFSAWKVGGSSLSPHSVLSSRSRKSSAVDAAEYFIHAVVSTFFARGNNHARYCFCLLDAITTFPFCNLKI